MARVILLMCLLVSACAPSPTATVFQPLSYNAKLPRVSVYPEFVFPGGEVIVMARPSKALPAVEACVRVIDADGFAWQETCGDTASRRIPFRPSKAGTHIAYLYYPMADGPVHFSADRAEFCVVGEGADCP
jgi:hypothetical protein